jgi:hypothetical protein
VLLDYLSCRDVQSVDAAYRRIEPPHVGCDIGVSARQPNQQVGRLSVTTTGERPVEEDEASHPSFLANLVREAALIQEYRV